MAAFEGGRSHFPLLCERMLHGRRDVALAYWTPSNCRARPGHTPPAFDDGDALFTVVRERELEGLVAKRTTGTYRPGYRGWVKVKNRGYWRFGQERELAERRHSSHEACSATKASVETE